MKAIKYLLLILLCFCTTQIYSQKKAEWFPDSLASEIPRLRKQADEWKQRVKEEPANEEAWFRYTQSIQALQAYTRSDSALTLEINTLMGDAARVIPNTPTYAFMQIYLEREKHREMTFEKIMDKWPDSVLHYPLYFSILQSQKERQKDLCIRWYNSGAFSPQMLNFAYNELVATDKDAVIFTDLSTAQYGCYLLQYGKGMFTDKRYIITALLFSPPYMDQVTEELGIPKYENKTPDFYKSSTPVTSFAEQIKERMDHIIKYTKRPVYLSVSVLDPTKALFKDRIHPEGLLMKYSDKPYDNLAIMRRNFESTYLLDYLQESFSPEVKKMLYLDTRLIEMQNLCYVPAFKSLLQFYKESDDQTHYDKLHKLLESVIKNAKSCDEDIREKYLKSINIQ